MRQPTRYYITKSGEESTVRSVRIARSAAEPAESTDTDVTIQSELSPASHERAQPEHGFNMKDRLQVAIRKRVLAH